MSSSPSLTQSGYRVRTDSLTVDTASPTWAALENIPASIAVETPFRIRFVVYNNGSAAGAGPHILRVSKNGGTYTAVTTSTGATLGAQSESTASSDADETTIATANFRLSSSVFGTASSGIYDETGSATKSLTNGFYTEFEYGLILKTAGATLGDVFDFRIYNSTTVYANYNNTARVVVPQTGTNFTHSDARQVFNNAGQYNSAGFSSLALNLLPSQPAVAVGDLLVFIFATDNSTTADADAGIVTSITDTGGNTYSKAKEWQFGSPGVMAGTGCGIWYTQATTGMANNSSSIVTVNYSDSSSRDTQAIIVSLFQVAAGKTVSVEASNNATGTGTTPASLNATTANIECLRIRAVSLESNQTLTNETKATSGWTAIGQGQRADSGSSATSQELVAEYKISTGTGSASAPAAFASSADHCSVYVAFRADSSGLTACLANDVSSATSVTQPAVQQVHALLANDISSATSVTQPALVMRRDLLANDISSATSVSSPAATIFVQYAILANDISSATSVTQPTAVIRRDLLANDISSATSVTQPAVQQVHGILANDVSSATSVTQPAAIIRRDLLANDVSSATSVTQPAAVIGRNLLANDVSSATSVTTPAVQQQYGILANDVSSATSVTQPALLMPGQISAEDVTSATSVSQPAVHQLHGILANDVSSATSVSQPAVQQLYGLLANDISSATSVTTPEITIGEGAIEYALNANDIVSATNVSQPQINPEVVIVPPELPLGGAGAGGGGAYRKAWQREFDRRRAREEGLTLRQYLDRIEVTAKKGSDRDRIAIEKSAAVVREAIDAGLAETAALARLLAAAAEMEVGLLALQMKAAEQAALEDMADFILEEDRFYRMAMERIAYDDALAAVLLLSA